MRLPLYLVAALALLGALLAVALIPVALPVERPEPPRGRLANLGLDHAEMSDPPPELQPAPDPRNEVLVTLRDRAYEPREMSLPVGTLVVFQNRDTTAHTVTARLAGQVAERADQALQPGEEFRMTLGQPGTYELRCKWHSDAYGKGMAMSVLVER
jgi:plastocyanin